MGISSSSLDHSPDLLPRSPLRSSRYSSKPAQLLSSVFALTIALPISIMAIWVEGVYSPYYAGLNLVAIGTLSFLPLSKRFYALTVLAIYGPYVAFCFTASNTVADLRMLSIH